MSPRRTVPLRSFTLLALAVFLIACTTQLAPEKATVKAEKDRHVAPNFTLKDASGAPVKLSDFRGKVVLLNFWATWCGPCKVEIPWFVDFQQRFKDRDLIVLGVSMDDDGWKSVTPYLADHKINYRIMIGTEEVSQQYGGLDALPTTFVVDRDGRIASTHVGLVRKSEYENEILNLLQTPGPKQASRGVAAGSFAAFLWTR